MLKPWVLVQDMSKTSTQNPNVFQMSPDFKQVSEELDKETKHEHSSLLALEWLPTWESFRDLPQLSEGTAVPVLPLPSSMKHHPVVPAWS